MARRFNFTQNEGTPIDQQSMELDDVRAELSLHKLENQNVEFTNSPGFFITYILGLGFARFLLGLIFSPEYAWTVLNILHGSITEYIIHWVKGAPFVGKENQDINRFDKLTWWEQLDHGVHWTPGKKMFMLIPTMLYAFTIHYGHYTFDIWLIINSIVFFVCIISKLPFMHGIRLFGINKD